MDSLLLWIGYLLIAVSWFVGITNCYLSFVRPLISKDRANVSGIPAIGSVLILIGAYLVGWNSTTTLAVVGQFAVDTGGILWFAVMMFFQNTKEMK